MSPHRAPTVSPLGSSVDLPHMAPHEALIVTDILERIVSALWDAYGDEMAEIAAEEDLEPPEESPSAHDGSDDIPW